MLERPLQKQKEKGKVYILYCILSFISPPTIQDLLIQHILTIYLALYIKLLFTDANKNHADDLTRLATLDVEDVLAKIQDISKGVLFNIATELEMLKQGKYIDYFMTSFH